MIASAEQLFRRWQNLSAPSPGLSEAAATLGCSEAELLGSACGQGVVRLQGAWPELLAAMPSLGRVLCLTRNPVISHERVGTFENIGFYGDIGVVLGPEIDLRLFMERWHCGYAVVGDLPPAVGRGFFFCDSDGTLVLSVILQPGSEESAFLSLTSRFLHPDQCSGEVVWPLPPRTELPDSEIDADGFREAWKNLEDTSYFADLLKKFNLRREQALRLAPPGYARTVDFDCIEFLLDTLCVLGLSAMFFVRSPGCLQIHTGPIGNLRSEKTGSVRVDGQDFRLALHLPLVASAWVVRKPTLDGIITSLELFDGQGQNIALFFGKRGYGQPERSEWRRLLASLK